MEDFSFFDDNSLNDFEQSLASSEYLFPPPEQSDLFGHFETFENFGSSTLTMPSFESTLFAKANNSVSDSFIPSSSTATLSTMTSASYHDQEQVDEVSGSGDVLSLKSRDGNNLDGGGGCNDLFTEFNDMSDFSSCPTLNLKSLSSSVNMEDLPRFDSLKARTRLDFGFLIAICTELKNLRVLHFAVSPKILLQNATLFFLENIISLS